MLYGRLWFSNANLSSRSVSLTSKTRSPCPRIGIHWAELGETYVVRQKQLLIVWLKHGGKLSLFIGSAKTIPHWLIRKNIPWEYFSLADWNVPWEYPLALPSLQLTHIGHWGAFCHQYLWNVRANICRRNRTLFDNYSVLSFDNISHCRPWVTSCHVSTVSPFFSLLQLAFVTAEEPCPMHTCTTRNTNPNANMHLIYKFISAALRRLVHHWHHHLWLHSVGQMGLRLTAPYWVCPPSSCQMVALCSYLLPNTWRCFQVLRGNC